jgi:hypothetical protein
MAMILEGNLKAWVKLPDRVEGLMSLWNKE